MIKLYRLVDGHRDYWEAWPAEEPPGTAVVHEGRLGEPGMSREVSCGADFDAWARQQAEEKQAAGFRPLTDEAHDVLLVKWPAEVLPEPVGIEPVWEELELLVNETLGWTGLGRCTGMDYSGTTSHTMELTAIAIAVDATLAIPVLARALTAARRAEGAVIAVREDERDVIRRPAEQEGSPLDP